MAVTVLVVDDSSFFRRRVVEILRDINEVKIIGTAANGLEAIEKNAQLSPDVITMDYEMPLMDGISAIQHIMKDKPTAILMFSSLTFEGARVTLDALAAGALDFLPKSFESMSSKKVDIGRVLADRILALVNKKDKKENLERTSDNLSRDRAFLDANESGESVVGNPRTATTSQRSGLSRTPLREPLPRGNSSRDAAPRDTSRRDRITASSSAPARANTTSPAGPT